MINGPRILCIRFLRNLIKISSSFIKFVVLIIGKLIVWGKDRNTAIKRMNRALNECAVTGIPTTINFHLTLLNKSKFKQGKIHTKYVEEELLPNY